MSEHVITVDKLQQYHNGVAKPLKERVTTLEELGLKIINGQVFQLVEEEE